MSFSFSRINVVQGETSFFQRSPLAEPPAGCLSGCTAPQVLPWRAGNDLSQEALEHTYLSILISQGKIGTKTAEELFKNLKGVPGFVSTMKKASSINPAQQMGHLFELRLANEARKQGFSVLGIGTKFRDFAKKGLTDMDLLLERGGKKFFVEAKNYPDVDWVSLPLFRRDMESLVHAEEVFGHAERCFMISILPSNPNIISALKAAAEKNGVKLIFGSVESAVSQVF